jgi:uncharacterized protein
MLNSKRRVATGGMGPERVVAPDTVVTVEEPSPRTKTIWVDLDNSPHVPFFRPIINELSRRGYSVMSTARNCFQVGGLAEQMHLRCKAIGRHYGKNRVMKFIGLGIRTLQLLPLIRRGRPQLAVSHGSRSQLVAAKLLGIPTLQIVDYEFAKIWMFIQPDWVLIPTMIPNDAINLESNRILKYPGIKEDVYVPSFLPDDRIRKELGISDAEILVTIRPPATEAHYHNPKSDSLFQATVAHLAYMSATRMVVLPRTERQAQEIRSSWADLCESRKLIIPDQVVDGLNLIWHSDLVISGGGTMNREAAALGVPVYSIFRGKIGAVDRFLAESGRMVLLESADDLHTKLQVCQRRRSLYSAAGQQATLEAVVRQIASLADSGFQKKNNLT